MMHDWQFVGERRELIEATEGKCAACGEKRGTTTLSVLHAPSQRPQEESSHDNM